MQENYKLIITGEIGSENYLAKFSLAVRTKIADSIGISIGELNDSRIDFGSFYDNRTFVSQDFLKISFNMSSKLNTSQDDRLAELKKNVEQGSLQFKDSGGLQWNIPRQNFKGSLSAYPSLVAAALNRRYYNKMTGQAGEIAVNHASLICMPDNTLKENVPIIDKWIPRSNLSFRANQFKVYSKPCESPNLFIFELYFIATNDYKTVSSNLKNVSYAIQNQLNLFLQNSDSKVLDVKLSKIAINGTYQMPTVAIRECIQVILKVRSISNSPTDPLESLLGEPWPPIYVNNVKLFIPAQKFGDTFRNVQLNLALARQTLPFQLVGSIRYLGDEGLLASNVTKQLSSIMNLSAGCFSKPQLLYNRDVIFYIDISSICDDGVVDISDANDTFWRLLNAGDLVLQDVSGHPCLAQAITTQVIRLCIFIITELNPASGEMSEVRQTLYHYFQKLFDRNHDPNYSASAGLIYDTNTNVAMKTLRVDIRLAMPCGELKKVNILNGTTLGSIDGTRVTIPKQILRRHQECLSNFNWVGSMEVITMFIQPVLDEANVRVRYNLSCFYNESQEEHLLATLQSKAHTGSNFGALFQHNKAEMLFNFPDKCPTNYLLEINWFKLNVLVDSRGVLKGFSGIQNTTDFASAFISQYLAYHEISEKRLLPGTNVSGVAYAGFYNGQWTPEMLTDVIQVSFVVVTITGLQGVDRPTHGGFAITYNNETLFAPLQYANGSAVDPAQIRNLEILIECEFRTLVESNETAFVDDFKRQVSTWTKIPSDYLMYHAIGTYKPKSTQFRLNVTSQFRNESIDLDALYGNFTQMLGKNKMTIKDEYNYPIHILPLRDHTFIIIDSYDETYLKTVPGITAAVILILTVGYMDIKFRIKSWCKKRVASRNAISPQSQAE